MAPGLNGRQTGAVPKSKPRNSGVQSHRVVREGLVQSASLEWEPVLDHNSRSRSHRNISSAHSEAEDDLIRYDLATSLSSAMTSQMRFEDTVNEGNSQDIHGDRMRVNIPDKKQVINKITQIQDYIHQTASLMNALKSSDCPEKKKQYDKLSVIMDDLKDSESKLTGILKNLESTGSRKGSTMAGSDDSQGENNNSDITEEDFVRRTEESKKKLELLQRRKQELIELQQKARKQLQEAQVEQSRLVARASTLNQDINSNRYLDLNVQQLSQRLKTAQQLYKTSNQINDTLADGRETNMEEPEHPDEDQTEMSDTETDFQIVSDKVAELNMMKAQLAQIQKIMANISLDSSARESTSTPTEMTEDRTEQGAAAQPPKTLRNEPVEENSNNALKLEQAKVKLNQLTQLLEMAQSAPGSKGLASGYVPMGSSEEGALARRSPSPSFSGRSQQRPHEELYMETMQLMTRELEERTAAMKEEHDRLIAARQELENLARKIPMGKADRNSLSPDDSGSEAPCLTNIAVDSTGRLMGAGEQQSPCNERSSYGGRQGYSKSRQRGAWSVCTSSVNQRSVEKKSKNEDMSRSHHQANGSVSRDQPRWSPSPSISFRENSPSPIVVQAHSDKSGRMPNDVHQRPARMDEITVDELYAQHQALTRTVAQCSHLLWLQQKQIIELRNTLMLQQSTMFQSGLPQSACGNQRNAPLPVHPFQFNPMPNLPFPLLTHPSQMTIPQHEQNYLSPNPSLKLNSIPNIQTPQDFAADQYYQGGAHPSLPFDALDYQFRCGNYGRSNAQHINSNSNVNQNLNQSGASGLNNRIPVGGMSCLGPEDSGALNNQVPPGNRANNYWDNFRSYSRQNLLSHSKSNEDTDSARRTSTTSNQERPLRETSSTVMVQNNGPAGPSHDPSASSSAFGAGDPSEYDVCQSPSGQSSSSATRPNQVLVSRSRSVEIQNHRKNESRNQENDSRNLNPKNEPRARNPEPGSDNIRSARNNDVNQCGRNSDNVNSGRTFVQLVRDLDNDVSRNGINKKRLDKSASRNEGRGNLNNRASSTLPVVLRHNVYSEVTNFIRANENRPHFLIQLFRDLQQVTTDPLRQRTLESIQETVNVNNLAERSNLNGANLNIIDNRNNIRENRSNLNRNQGEETSLDSIVSQNASRQNITGNSGLACAGSNLENPNISNIRNLGNSRNNLESEGLRDLRTYFEANLCNFGHNSALENPNLSNIRENLTRRGNAGDLDNGNPKNLYLSMYDNAWRRNQETNSCPEFMPPFDCRNVDQVGGDCCQNGFRDNNAQCSCVNQVPLSPVAPRLDMQGDRVCSENRQVPVPRYCRPDRDSKYVNVAREVSNEEDSEVDNNFNNEVGKSGFTEDSSEGGVTVKENRSEEEVGEEVGAAAMLPPEWGRDYPKNSCCDTLANSSRSKGSSSGHSCYEPMRNFKLQLDNGDLAEADQSRNEEATGAENGDVFVNFQASETGSCFASDDNRCPPNEVEEENSCCLQDETEGAVAAVESSLSDCMREGGSEGSDPYEVSESEEMF